MTNEELQTVVAAVIQALKTNGKTIDQLTPVTSIANSDSLEVSGGKKIAFSKLKELVASAVVVTEESIKSWVVIESTDALPVEPTTEEQMKAYVLADKSTLYVYVGEGGDTLNGSYQSVIMKGADGKTGPKGDSGVHLGDVVLVNDLTTGGEGNALSAEMGKVLNKKTEAVSEKLSEVGGKVDELKSEVIYDVTANNDGVIFDSLSALLSDENLSTLIPTSVRCGGMSIRFIQGSVPNFGNKYVQYRLTSQTFTTIVDYWQDETELKLSNIINDSDLDFTDEEGNVLVRFSDGGIKTKNFDSSEVDLKVGNGNDSEIDLEFIDEKGNVLIRASEGHIRTSKFNSKMFTGNQYTNTYYGERINLYGNTYDIEKIELNSVSTTPPRQGFDISNGLGVILQHTGICNIFNLETLQLIQSFNLASYDPVNNHANTLSFGKDVAEGSEFPLMYISIGTVGAANGFTCSVEKIVKNNDIYSSVQFQTIKLDVSGFAEKGYTAPWDVPTWLIDKKRNYLWTFSAKKRTTSNYTSSFSENYYIAHQYNIPNIDESSVVLTADDVLKECVFPFDVYATQGGTMLDGKIYYCFGFGGIGTEHSNVRVYDTDNNGISSAIDLIGNVPEECEDIAIFNGNLYLSTSSEFIYKLKF